MLDTDDTSNNDNLTPAETPESAPPAAEGADAPVRKTAKKTAARKTAAKKTAAKKTSKKAAPAEGAEAPPADERPTAEDRAWFPQIAGGDWQKVLDFAMRNYKDDSFIAQYLSPRLMREMRFALYGRLLGT